MKFLHDAKARLIAAREIGREKGIAKGRVVGKIQMLPYCHERLHDDRHADVTVI